MLNNIKELFSDKIIHNDYKPENIQLIKLVEYSKLPS
jgi:hypothetical protein